MNKCLATLLLLIFAGCVPCLADTGLSEAAQHEINRRGTAVERVGGGHEASESTALWEALKPPEDDSHKWYITLITAPSCAPCKRLYHDFADSPELRPWANPRNHRESFTHYDVIQISDPTQGWRFKELKGNQFPVVVIQPPKSGRFGDPTKCLEPIIGYDGNPRAMAAAIKQRIKDYVEHYREAATSYRGKRTNREPVFQLPPDEQILPPEVEGDDFFSQPLAPEKIMQTVASIAVLGALALLFVRELRRQTGQQVFVSDQAAAEVGKVARVDHATVAAIVSAVLAALSQAKKDS